MLYIADREKDRPEVWPFRSIIQGKKAVGQGERRLHGQKSKNVFVKVKNRKLVWRRHIRHNQTVRLAVEYCMYI